MKLLKATFMSIVLVGGSLSSSAGAVDGDTELVSIGTLRDAVPIFALMGAWGENGTIPSDPRARSHMTSCGDILGMPDDVAHGRDIRGENVDLVCKVMQLPGETSKGENARFLSQSFGAWTKPYGDYVSWCSVTGGCPSDGSIPASNTGASFLASGVLATTTRVDGGTAQEVNQAFNFVSNSGYSPRWATSSRYSSVTPSTPQHDSDVDANGGIYRNSVDGCLSAASGRGPSGFPWTRGRAYDGGAAVIANGAQYVAITGGTSSASRNGPKGKGTNIADGSVVWSYVRSGTAIPDGTCSWTFIGPDVNSGKSNVSFATSVYAGATNTWGLVANYIAHGPGDGSSSLGSIQLYPFEHDASNYNEDASIGNLHNFGMVPFLIGGQGEGTFPFTAYFQISRGGRSHYGAQYGMLWGSGQPNTLIGTALFADGTNGTFGYQALGNRTHLATFEDESNSTAVLRASGMSSSGATMGGTHAYFLDDESASNTVLRASGTHQYGIDFSNVTGLISPFIMPNGTYIGFNGTGDYLGHNGALNALTFGPSASGATYSYAAYDNGDFGIGQHLFARPASVRGKPMAPVLSGAGVSPSLSPGANDTHGTVTEGQGAAGFILTFAAARVTPPDCVVSSPTGTALLSYGTSATALTLINASGNGAKFTYHCLGQ